MKFTHFLAFAGFLVFAFSGGALAQERTAADKPGVEWALAIHGGAGVINRESMTAEDEATYKMALETALQAGAAILSEGGSAIDAVEAATVSMENDPLFNAGVGAVFTAAGEHEMDASIMSGIDRKAGAVAGIKTARNPIKAARAVMDRSEHVLFAGKGADVFARDADVEQVANTYFDTDRRREALERVLKSRTRTDADRHGTVGAVAIDQAGNLAAATTTGGMTAKAAGRVGDSPLIGAGTYAQNGVCAVSATGHGEYFIRVGVARAICARVELLQEPIRQAAQTVLQEVAALGGDGGVILMDGSGRADFVFNSQGMYRGQINADGFETAIYQDEKS